MNIEELSKEYKDFVSEAEMKSFEQCMQDDVKQNKIENEILFTERLSVRQLLDLPEPCHTRAHQFLTR